MDNPPLLEFEIPGVSRPYVMAHRGDLVHCPENTPASFRKAIDDGTDLIETDVHVTADGHFVCIHDETVDRTTDGSGAVRDMSLEDVKGLSASCGRREFTGERVPTLQEVFDLLPADMVIALELKTDDFLDPEIADRLVAEIEVAGRQERTVILSFEANRVLAVRRQALAAGMRIPAGTISLTQVVPRGGVELTGPAWPLLLLNPFYVWWAHRKGLRVCPLDPSPDGRLWLYRWLGCDAVLTDDPGATLRCLGR
jgi:glycerophosphoryl diester phosphodiesterase